MFTIPHRDPTTADEAAENGLALLEWNGLSMERLRFLIAADLENFSMSDGCNCVVGRSIGWDDHDEKLVGFNLGDDPTFGFDVPEFDEDFNLAWDYAELERAWRDLLSLPL